MFVHCFVLWAGGLISLNKLTYLLTYLLKYSVYLQAVITVLIVILNTTVDCIIIFGLRSIITQIIPIITRIILIQAVYWCDFVIFI